MKTYEEACAKVQECIDEKHFIERKIKKLDTEYFDVPFGCAEEERLEREIGYLRWRNSVLEGHIPGAISMLRFIFEDDGHDVMGDIDFHFSEEQAGSC